MGANQRSNFLQFLQAKPHIEIMCNQITLLLIPWYWLWWSGLSKLIPSTQSTMYFVVHDFRGSSTPLNFEKWGIMGLQLFSLVYSAIIINMRSSRRVPSRSNYLLRLDHLSFSKTILPNTYFNILCFSIKKIERTQ